MAAFSMLDCRFQASRCMKVMGSMASVKRGFPVVNLFQTCPVVASLRIQKPGKQAEQKRFVFVFCFYMDLFETLYYQIFVEIQNTGG